MGLDFYVVKVKKSDIDFYGSAREATKHWNYNTFEENELAYARKGWELVHFLGCGTNYDCMSKLYLEPWVDLMESLSHIEPFFDEIWDAYDTIDNHSDKFETYAQLKANYPRELKLENTYEEWHERTFDGETPQLGYKFSIGYMKDFWEAADEVLKYLEDPEYEVWMIASY